MRKASSSPACQLASSSLKVLDGGWDNLPPDAAPAESLTTKIGAREVNVNVLKLKIIRREMRRVVQSPSAGSQEFSRMPGPILLPISL